MNASLKFFYQKELNQKWLNNLKAYMIAGFNPSLEDISIWKNGLYVAFASCKEVNTSK